MGQQGPPPESASPEKGRAPSSKITNGLVALSSAAILTVYAAGYLRTRAAAERFVVEAADKRPEEGRTALPPSELRGLDEQAAAAARDITPQPQSGAGTAPASAGSVRTNPAEAGSPNPAKAGSHVGAESLNPVEAGSHVVEGSNAAGAGSRVALPEPIAESRTPVAEPTPTETVAAVVDSSKTEPPAAPAVPDSKYKDGKYLGWGYSRHGDLQAAVVVQGGRIVSAEITQCLTRYSCDILSMLPGQVIERQNPFIDLISGATESANAYSNAIYRALKASEK